MSTTTTSILFNPTDAKVWKAFYLKLRSKAKANVNKDVIKAFLDPTTVTDPDDLAAASAELYECIVQLTCPNALAFFDLISNPPYLDDGVAVLTYLMSIHTAGGNDDKLARTSAAYYELRNVRLDPGVMLTHARERIFGPMQKYHSDMTGTKYAVAAAQYVQQLEYIVSNISSEYKILVRMAMNELSAAQRDLPEVVTSTLEGVITTMESSVDSHARPGATASAVHDVSAIVAEVLKQVNVLQVKSSSTSRSGVCNLCGIGHWGANDTTKCYAYLVAHGKRPDSWDTLSAQARANIEERAKKIRGKSTDANTHVAALEVVLPKNDIVLATSPGHPTREYGLLHIDSKAGAGTPYHFISDRVYFTRLDTDDANMPRVRIGGAVKGAPTTLAQGVGTCAMIVTNTLGVQVTITLANCLYTPGLDFNLFNVSAAYAYRGVRTEFNGVNCIEFADGMRVPFTSDYTLFVRPTDAARIDVAPMQATADALESTPETFTRARGPTHHQGALTEHEYRELRLWSARYNDPSAKRLRDLGNLADNAPEVLRKADDNVVMSDARLLANMPSLAHPARGAPIASRPGATIMVDGSTPPGTSLLGNAYEFIFMDGHTSYLMYVPTKSKDGVVAATEECLTRFGAHANVSLAHGVLYSDNEAVLNSRALDTVATKFSMSRLNSAEYTPQQNPVERGVGLIKQERRKMHVRTGVPYAHFFEWSSWEAARLLNETRTRGDEKVSIKEMVTGRRVDMATPRAAWGSRAIVRKPIAWRDGKETTAQAVDGMASTRATSASSCGRPSTASCTRPM
jgi:hypothetical protein